jgi:hypothetical protein
MNYPYLGIKFVDDKKNVVFFTSENRGVVVLDETMQDGFTFGTNGEFSEDDYDFLPDKDENGVDICVRINN